ncbi:aconitate hydratase AcnA [Anaerocolumna xylanovorans]|uniref:Aconitate hydratase n=1 Tax=Anaerocolumna xylanovorans DSM 12503 TaxID=1121345 RepID=A0A1M7Y4M1_9FIRM|nr:aconitate hydratase AcnA [Anaerocolumna xylanovorans]SHO47285.1 aconitate hydratase [Anaerocolumna xylanovorans DSM 12503]
MNENLKEQALRTFIQGGKTYTYYSIYSLKEKGFSIEKLPVTIKILLEGAIRQLDHKRIKEEHIYNLAGWKKDNEKAKEVPYKPSRVLLQDFTGVPVLVDLASMGLALKEEGKRSGKERGINPEIPVELVIDHSVQVDSYGRTSSLSENMELEYTRNKERYEFLKWAQKSFRNLRVVPPGMGIIHQVNLEYLASVVTMKEEDGKLLLFPDTLVGTDSHTTMVNGLGVLGWGVGGIEAEAIMLGEPSYMMLPEVVGVRLTGELKEGATATDLALTVTAMLRKLGVVGCFVEFYGEGLNHLTLADRATVANMAPEYGATCGYFPFDEETYHYLLLTGRPKEEADRIKAYLTENGMIRRDGEEAEYTKEVTLDLSTVTASLAGPKRPQDIVPLRGVKEYFKECVTKSAGNNGYGLSGEEFYKKAKLSLKEEDVELKTGDIVLAAVTSCTNTSNPYVMLGAGLMAKKAVELGLTVPSYVKTSLAPGSLIVSDYLKKAGLTPYLEQLGFHTVGYGCTTCIGNSGKLLPEIEKAITEENLLTASVLSGNRNFEGRIHPLIKANFLASPILVIAYALAGTILIDFAKEPIARNHEGQDIFLKNIWPSSAEIQSLIKTALKEEMFQKRYEEVWLGDRKWQELKAEEADTYDFGEESTYIRNPPYFDSLLLKKNPGNELKELRVLAKFADSVTTDHISPAGNIGKSTPAASYLLEKGVEVKDFNTYGSRRGNHEVMMRGTFANIRIKNQLADGREGGFTKYFRTGEILSIYEAALLYKKEERGLLIIAGKDYGMGSSRDWAAKGTALLGVKAVLAESFERIHRSNLVMMGVLPFEFMEGESAESLGLTGEEYYTFHFEEKNSSSAAATAVMGEKIITFPVKLRIDSAAEWEYYHNGGILPMIARRRLRES